VSPAQVVARERIGVPHGFLECHELVPDALFEQRLRRPAGRSLFTSSVWRLRGIVVADGGRSTETAL
jgi:hypothetical protein